jgi:putative Mg2+ transporter-C (MgtC) family protein
MLDQLFDGTELGLGPIAFRLGLAAVLGAVIGLDRELKDRPMGLRTIMMVAVGSALFGVLVIELGHELAGREGFSPLDPARVVEGIIGGIGFLGAGAIIRRSGQLVGGTTGAVIWAMGGVGLAAGLGLFELAILTTVLLFLIVTVLGIIEKRLQGQHYLPETRAVAGSSTGAQPTTGTNSASPGRPSA